MRSQKYCTRLQTLIIALCSAELQNKLCTPAKPLLYNQLHIIQMGFVVSAKSLKKVDF
jgi:hypothetical protein